MIPLVKALATGEEDVEAGVEKRARRRRAVQEQVRRGAPHGGAVRRDEPGDSFGGRAHEVHREQPVRKERARGRLVDLGRGRSGGALREVKRPKSRGRRPFRIVERVDGLNPHDAHGKIPVEISLPRVVVDDRSRAAEDVLERAEEERVAARQQVPPCEVGGEARMEIRAPGGGARVRRFSDARQVIAVEMVVRVHEPRHQRGAAEIERQVGGAGRRGESAAFDVARRIPRFEPESHFEKRSARSSGRPSSAA